MFINRRHALPRSRNIDKMGHMALSPQIVYSQFYVFKVNSRLPERMQIKVLWTLTGAVQGAGALLSGISI